MGSAASGYAGARVRDAEAQAPCRGIVGVQRHADLALLGIADRIDHEVRQHLIDPRRIGNDEDGAIRKAGGQLEPLGIGKIARASDERLDQRGRLERLGVHLQPARLPPGQGEQIPKLRIEKQGGTSHPRDQLCIARLKLAVPHLHEIERGDNSLQR